MGVNGATYGEKSQFWDSTLRVFSRLDLSPMIADQVGNDRSKALLNVILKSESVSDIMQMFE